MGVPSNINICPGDVLSFKCTAHGGTGTIWQGSIFDCTDRAMPNEIILLHGNHSTFVQQRKICNNGTIVVQGIYAINNSFTSQLNITVSIDMFGKTIECIQARGSEISVGSYVINYITAGKYKR